MKIEDEALEVVVQKGYNMAFGARFLKRYIDEHIKLPISARWKEGTHFDVRAIDGAIVVEPGIAQVVTSPDEALLFGDVA
jgi:ATP-dependent Clp protease ATP-binding subunit ClpA